MCGIAGYIARKSVDRSVLGSMLEPLAVRGPDAEGRWFDSVGDLEVGLGHRRLSVLDLSEAANQPMERDGLVAVHNGEIYNFVELREELVARGVEFATSSDTEVLIEAYRAWGSECVQRFNGMFAFALWDRCARRLFCARDRMGEKPFYYWHGERGFVFASELKSLLRFGAPVPREPNYDRVVDMLETTWQAAHRETFFRGVFELPPAHSLEVSTDPDEAKLGSVRRYWRFPAVDTAEPLTAAEVRHLLDESLRLRLRSDVPIGTSLSGGVDSPSVVASARSQAADVASFRYVGVHAYAPVPEADEREYVALLGEHLGVEVENVEVSGDGCRDELDELVYRQDEPFLGPSIYAQRCVFRRASELGLTVMLDGQGADELFGGYDWAVPKALAGIWRECGAGAALREARTFAGPRFRFVPLVLRSVLSRLRGSRTGLPDDLHAALVASRDELSLPSLLRFADRNSMSFGVEARLPFLDHRLIEACARLTATACASAGFTKALLRDAMTGRVPERVLRRRDKTAFAVPEPQWVRGELRDAVCEAATDPLWRELPNGSRVVRSALAELEGAPYHRMAWKVLCISRWHRCFFVDRN